MNTQEMWQRFCKKENIKPSTPYEAWAFGGTPDELADLVIRGIKTATASGYDLYALDETESMPEVGDISVILNSREEAVCVIRTTKVYAAPFDRVSTEHAWKEGEGDRSLAYWRQVHWDFFTGEFRQCGLEFQEKSLVLCEEFEVLYRDEPASRSLSVTAEA